MCLRQSGRLMLAMAAIAISPLSARAATTYWSGGATTQWTSPFAWTTLFSPGPTDTAYFDATGAVSTVNLSANTTINNWTVLQDSVFDTFYTFNRANNALLTANGAVTIGDPLGGAGPTLNGFAFTTPTLSVEGFSHLDLTNSSVATVTSETRVQNTAKIVLEQSTLTTPLVQFFESGRVEIKNGGIVNTNSVFTHPTSAAPTVHIYAGGRLNTDAITLLHGSLTVQDSGILNLNPGKTLALSNSGTAFNITNAVWKVPANGTLQADTGADIAVSTYLDVGIANTGTFTLDGSGTTLSITGVLEPSNWGWLNGGNFSGTFSNSAAATVQGLQLGTSDAAANLQILSGASLTVQGVFGMGGGATARTVQATINNGTLDLFGNAGLNNKADIDLVSGTLRFQSDATINAGARIDWTGGALNSTGVFLTLNGGTVARGSNGAELSNASTLRVLAGGQFTGAQYYDVANGNTTGTLLVDGAGSLLSASGTSDWGRNTGRTANVTISNGGLAQVSTLRVGEANAAATITLNSSGRLAVGSNLSVGGGTANRTVAVNVAGGTLEVTGISTFNDKANLTLSGGLLDFKSDVTFNAGSAFTWSGGSLALASGKTLTLNGVALNRTKTTGEPMPSGTALQMNAGSTFTSASYVDVPNGTMTIVGPSTQYTINGDLYVDWGLNSGDSATVNLNSAAVVNINSTGGGLHMATNGGTASINLSGGSQLNVSTLVCGGAPTSSAGMYVNPTLDPFNVTVANNADLRRGTTITMNGGRMDVNGTLSLKDNAKIVAAVPNASMTLEAGDLSITGTAKIDLGLGTMTITQNNTPTLQKLRGYLLAGYHNGDWLGNGITSSYVAGSTFRAVGYRPSGASTVVSLTRVGDTNLDLLVDFDDLLTVAQNYGAPGERFWSQGDFTYDGIVNFDDLLKLAQNYGLSALAAPTDLGDGFSSQFTSDWAMALALAPEPTCALGLVAGTLLVRRRR